MNKLLSLLFIVIACCACCEEPKTEGLWELHYADLDMVPRTFKPTFLQINADGSFSASQEDGDVVGIYSQSESIISFSSKDKKWFSKKWKVKRSGDELLLWDLENEFRAEQLRFKKIQKFPSFDKFHQEIIGKWELYKKQVNEATIVVPNTFISIEEHSYTILENDTLIESGQVLIDARHQKMVFESANTSWKVRQVWDELRVFDETSGITYRLRKATD